MYVCVQNTSVEKIARNGKEEWGQLEEQKEGGGLHPFVSSISAIMKSFSSKIT